MIEIGKKEKIKVLFKFIKPYKLSFISIFITLMTACTIDMLYPFLMSLLIDEVFYNRNKTFFKFIIICYLILFVTNQLIFLIQHYIICYLDTKFLFDIKKKVFDRTLRFKSSYLSNIRTGDVITRINQDTSQVIDFIFNNIYFGVADILRLVLIISLVTILNYRIALLIIVTVPINVYVSRFFGKRIQAVKQKYRDKYGIFISWAFEIIKGLRDIKLLAAERNVARQFTKDQSKLVHLKIKSSLIEIGCERTNSFISFITSIILYIVASILIVKGNMTVGAFIATIDYFSKATRFFSNINNKYMNIQQNVVSIDKVLHTLNEDIEEEKGKVDCIEIPNGAIEYRNVSFSYDSKSKILNNISLSIMPGEKIAIVGKSGAGKSTMINLLLRFYEADNGVISIDGKNIDEVSIKSLRGNIGIVQQESILFDGSIRENLKIANTTSTDEEIWDACEKAHIADFIMGLPNKLDTIVGMGGTNLSGGQKQRIAIARIFLKDPKVLIFDEATSALDSESEQYIYNSLKELSIGRTTIIIAHRLTTIMESDRVAVLDNGIIAACEHHLNLLNSCEEYQILFKEQYLGGEVCSA